MRRLLLLYVLLIVYLSLYPFRFNPERTLDSPSWIFLHSWPEQFGRSDFRDGAANVLLYVPLGFLSIAAFRRRWWAALALGAALSTSIELAQIYDADRYCSLFDVACNVAGTVIGAISGLMFPADRLFRPWLRRLRAGPAVVAACWAGYQLYPFVPILTLGHLRAAWAHLTSAPVSAVEVAATAAEWFAAALLLEHLLGGLKTRWFAIALLAIPLRLVIADRRLDPGDVAGGVIALLLWAAVPALWRVRAGAVLLGAAIVVRELAPFEFLGEPRPFSWIPFQAAMDADRLPGVLTILRKAFNYSAMIWLLRGLGTLRAGLIVAAALAALEYVQRYLPGRQPEITDSLLALMMVLPLLWGRRR